MPASQQRYCKNHSLFFMQMSISRAQTQLFSCSDFTS